MFAVKPIAAGAPESPYDIHISASDKSSGTQSSITDIATGTEYAANYIVHDGYNGHKAFGSTGLAASGESIPSAQNFGPINVDNFTMVLVANWKGYTEREISSGVSGFGRLDVSIGNSRNEVKVQFINMTTTARLEIPDYSTNTDEPVIMIFSFNQTDSSINQYEALGAMINSQGTIAKYTASLATLESTMVTNSFSFQANSGGIDPNVHIYDLMFINRTSTPEEMDAISKELEYKYFGIGSAPEPVPTTVPFTSTDLQDMVSLYTRVATEGEAVHTFTNETAVSFENKTFTHAFSSIDGAATELLTADGDYTVVAVGEQDGEYYAGYASLTSSEQISHEWLLLVRDSFSFAGLSISSPSTDLNFGDPLTNTYSRLGDLKDETGDFSNENIKTPLANGEEWYFFRMHSYTQTEINTGDLIDPNTNLSPIRYVQWAQPANPINTPHHTTDQENYSNMIYSGWASDVVDIQTGSIGYALGALIQSYHPTHCILDMCGYSTNFYWGIGAVSSSGLIHEGITAKMAELYVWKGTKPTDLSIPVIKQVEATPPTLTTTPLSTVPARSLFRASGGSCSSRARRARSGCSRAC